MLSHLPEVTQVLGWTVWSECKARGPPWTLCSLSTLQESGSGSIQAPAWHSRPRPSSGARGQAGVQPPSVTVAGQPCFSAGDLLCKHVLGGLWLRRGIKRD